MALYSTGTKVYIKSSHETTKVAMSYPIFKSTQHMYILDGFPGKLFPESELEFGEISLVAVAAGFQLTNDLVITKENHLQVVENLQRIIKVIKDKMKLQLKLSDSSDEGCKPPLDDDFENAKKCLNDSDSEDDMYPPLKLRQTIKSLYNKLENGNYINVATGKIIDQHLGFTQGVFTGPINFRSTVEWFYENFEIQSQ